MIYILNRQKLAGKEDKLSREDLPSVIGMISLDIVAPILLMIGLKSASAANASLLNNFEIVATSLIALMVFKEMISRRLWVAIGLITLSSVLLSFEDFSSFRFSYGSLFILLAATCWGLENNLTRRISDKSTYQIVTLKGIFSGLGSLIVALLLREGFPPIDYAVYALLLGFVAYGLSIFMYVRAQKDLGAAKTSAYYAIAPFVGALLSYLILKEPMGSYYILALMIMLVGSGMVVADTLILNHSHTHVHTFVHTHDGSTHSHSISHTHDHQHFASAGDHQHKHDVYRGVHTDGPGDHYDH